MEASETDEASQKVPGISVIQLKNVISNGEKKKLNSQKGWPENMRVCASKIFCFGYDGKIL